MEDKHLVENKSYNKHSILARWGLQHQCSQALLALREKQSATGFETVAPLYRKVNSDIEFHEAKIINNVLGKDTKEREFYRNNHGI